MKLGYLLELVLAMAVGLALALFMMERSIYSLRDSPVLYTTQCSFYILSGVVLVESIGLWIERARRRGPRPWGIGRRLWSILGVVCLCSWAWSVITAVLWMRLPRSPKIPFRLLILDHSAIGFWSEDLNWLPLALVITTCLAGLPRDPKPDGREWSGRLAGILILSLYLFQDIYSLYQGGVFKTF